ncbi:MAG: hypothetical protein ACKV19_03365 [Verrucomicrobiales bacterium]
MVPIPILGFKQDLRRLALAAVAAGACWEGALTAQEPAEPPPTPPTHRELWVPERSLAAALKTMPKAALVTREQFDSLLRASATQSEAAPHQPPAPAVLRSARYTGSLAEHAALFSAEFVVEGLSDRWTELPLTLDPRWLGDVTVEGTSALSASSEAAVLAVRGVGRRTVRVDFAVPILHRAGTRTLTLRAPGTVEASLALAVPEGVKLESSLPFTREQDTATFALPAGREDIQITWSAGEVPPIEAAGIFQDIRAVYALDAAQVRAELALTVQSALKPVPNAVSLPLPPGTEVLAAEGAELARWSLAGDRLVAEFLPGVRRRVEVRLQLALRVPDDATQLELPAPLADGVHRTSGVLTVLAHPGLRVRRVVAGALTTRDDSQSPPAVAGRAEVVGTWLFPVLLEPPRVEIERLTPRFTATLDTQVTLARDAIHFTRHIVFRPSEGSFFSPALDGLLDGERIDRVQRADGGEIDWRSTDRGVALLTPAGTQPGESLAVVVVSTLRPAGWNQLDVQPVALSLSSARLPRAEKISGYLAVAFDESLGVTTSNAVGLEPRDPRQFAGRLPLSGHLAWFRLDDFQIDLTVSRRTAEFDATLALDVLPLLNSLEIEGQVGLSVAHGRLKDVVIAFPAGMAAGVRWDSPLIAEKSLAEDGRWTLRFHQEIHGTPILRFHASLPLEDAAADGANERRFTVAAPFHAVPAARRLAGSLVVEANSDTELTLVPQALDELDLRLAPSIEGYAPRHRLVAGYAWRGGQPGLAINGVRHRAGELAAIVVDSLALDSVVSTDGPARHQAVLAIRSAGAQFIDLSLPTDARVLSAAVDGQAAKPIRGPSGSLRLPLGGSPSTIGVIYETPAARMTAVTRTTLPPLALDAKIPVLQTTWKLHLPEGFSYSDFVTDLTESSPPPHAPSLAQAITDSPLVAALIAPRHSAHVLMEIERSSGETAGDFYDPVSGAKAMLGGRTILPTEFEIITSNDTLAQVIKKRNLVDRWKVADLDAAYTKLERMVEASNEAGTDLVKIEVRSADKQEAAELANDVAEAYIHRRKEIEKERVQLAFETLSHTRQAQEQEVERARSEMLEVAKELGITDLEAFTRDSYRRGTEADGALDAAKFARYQQARDQYSMAQEIYKRMVDEQERARVVNLMPRQPVTVLSFAEAEADRKSANERTTVRSASTRLPEMPAVAAVDVSKPAEQPVEGFDISKAELLGATVTGTLPGAIESASTVAAVRPAMRVGLLPLEFSLPEGGRTLTFSGPFAPAEISFRAESWERQVRRAWILMVAGGLLFAVLHIRFRRPGLIGVLGALTGHFVPLLVDRPDWIPSANALLTGWLVALGLTLGLWLIERVQRFFNGSKEVVHA